MRFWILSIDSVMNTFSIIDAKHDIRYKFKLDAAGEGGNILQVKDIDAGDKILGYVNKPDEAVRYMFEVIDLDEEVVVLRKIYETVYGVKLDKISSIDEYISNMLSGMDQQQLFEISEQAYQLLFEQMFQGLLLNKSANHHNLKETPPNFDEHEEDIPPTKDPIADNMPHNLIVYGSPGTGKSFKLEEDRLAYFGSNFERVTFHPNMSYGQFVGTYKPRPRKGIESTITYELVPGPFLRVLAKALKNKANNTNYVLIVEEINRANTAATFGDIFQLLDRTENGSSEYSISLTEEMKDYLEEHESIRLLNNELYLPPNLYIWATMNTADQGVFPIDSAFKRRFEFEYIGINENENEIAGIEINIHGIGTIEWNKFRKILNDYLLEHVRNMKEDKLIGPFFIKKKMLKGTDEVFQRIFQNKLLMYLSEDILRTNKTLLFKHNSFSKIVQQYSEEKQNVFSDQFTAELEKIK